MSNKLFSDPILSTDNDLDKDYSLDSNGMDLDPNQESLYDLNNETDETDTSLKDEESTKNNVDIKDSDIFTTEPLNTQEVKKANQLTNNYAHKMDQTYNDTTINEYEDEPEELMDKTSRNWIIFGVIALIVLICGGWLVYSIFHKEDSQPKQQPITNVVVNPAPETQTPDNQQKTPTTDSSTDSNSNTSTPDDYYEDSDNNYYDDTNNPSSDNTGSSNNSTSSNQPAQDQSTPTTDNSDSNSQEQGTGTETNEDTQINAEDQTANSEGEVTDDSINSNESNSESFQNSYSSIN